MLTLANHRCLQLACIATAFFILQPAHADTRYHFCYGYNMDTKKALISPTLPYESPSDLQETKRQNRLSRDFGEAAQDLTGRSGNCWGVTGPSRLGINEKREARLKRWSDQGYEIKFWGGM